MSEGHDRISLWLIPDEPARGELASLIERTADHFGAPRFPPHVTLLGSLQLGRGIMELPEALRQAEAIASRALPPEARLPAFGTRPEYYRALFLRLERTALIEHAREAAERDYRALLCGRDPWDAARLASGISRTASTVRRAALDTARDALARGRDAILGRPMSRRPPRPFEPHVSVLYGDYTDDLKRQWAETLGLSAWPGRVKLGALEVWCTHGEVETWHKLGAFPLAGRGPEGSPLTDRGSKGPLPRAE